MSSSEGMREELGYAEFEDLIHIKTPRPLPAANVEQVQTEEIYAQESIQNVIDLQTESGSSDSDNVTTVTLEQCNICSAQYQVSPPHETPRPEINKAIANLLEITFPQLLPNGECFLSQFIPVCPDCINKLHTFEELKAEAENLQKEFVASLITTLLCIRPSGHNTLLHSYRTKIVGEWISRLGPTGSLTSDQHSRKLRIGVSSFVPQTEAEHEFKFDPVQEAPILCSSTITSPLVRTPPQTPTPIPVDAGSSAANDDVPVMDLFDAEAQDLIQAFFFGNEPQNHGVEALEQERYSLNLLALGDYLDDQTITSDSTVIASDIEVCDESACASSTSNSQTKRKAEEDEPGEGKRKQTTSQLAPPLEKPPFICEKCGRVFSKLPTLRTHIKTCVTGPGEEPIRCPICWHSLSKWLDLKVHIDDHHPNPTLAKCNFCRKDYFAIVGHDDCIRVVPPMETTTLFTHACDFCPKVYFKYTCLTEHVRRCHKGAEKFNCSFCHKKFVNKVARETHEKVHPVIPDKKRANVCSTCGLVFSTAWGLKEHGTVHNGLKPFPCEICGKAFRLHNMLKHHMIVHTKEKNYACEFCGKTFTLYATMFRHWKNCRNPSPLRKGRWCPICLHDGTLFRKLSRLKAHMLRTHSGTPEQEAVWQETGEREFGFEAAAPGGMLAQGVTDEVTFHTQDNEEDKDEYRDVIEDAAFGNNAKAPEVYETEFLIGGELPLQAEGGDNELLELATGEVGPGVVRRSPRKRKENPAYSEYN